MTQKWGQRLDAQRKDRREERKGRKDSGKSYGVGENKNSAPAMGSAVHRRAHTSHLSEGASPDLECFSLIPSTGHLPTLKPIQQAKEAERSKPFCLWLHITRGAGKMVGSNGTADERVPDGDKMSLFSLWQESTSLDTYSHEQADRILPFCRMLSMYSFVTSQSR